MFITRKPYQKTVIVGIKKKVDEKGFECKTFRGHRVVPNVFDEGRGLSGVVMSQDISRIGGNRAGWLMLL